MRKKSLRNSVFDYIKEKYGSEIEHLWSRFPNYAVFRHEDNRKWYGIVMDVRRSSVGMAGDGRVDVVNVKIDDYFLLDSLERTGGCFRGYHMGKGKWVSILLDGTVPLEDVFRCIDASYDATASAARKSLMRPPKEWIVPANPAYYDVEKAFGELETVEWKQGRGVRAGDVVFMYVASPVSAILYKCAVEETGIPCGFKGGPVIVRELMRLRILRRYPPDRFTFDVLKGEYGIFAVRGPRGVPNSLSFALNEE